MTTAAYFTLVTALNVASARAETTTIHWADGQTVTVQGSGAELELRAWNQDHVRVQSTLSRSLDRVKVQHSAEAIHIRLVPLVKGQPVYGKVVVDVPANAALSVFTLSGDVKVDGLEGALDVTSLSASVDARGIRSPRVYIRSSSGAVTLAAKALDELSLATASGRISYAGNLEPGADCTLESLSGKVEIVDDPGLAALGILDTSLARAK